LLSFETPKPSENQIISKVLIWYIFIIVSKSKKTKKTEMQGPHRTSRIGYANLYLVKTTEEQKSSVKLSRPMFGESNEFIQSIISANSNEKMTCALLHQTKTGSSAASNANANAAVAAPTTVNGEAMFQQGPALYELFLKQKASGDDTTPFGTNTLKPSKRRKNTTKKQEQQ
jgi:hypothetical protein